MVAIFAHFLPENFSIGVRSTVLVSAAGAKQMTYTLVRTATIIAAAAKRNKENPEIYKQPTVLLLIQAPCLFSQPSKRKIVPSFSPPWYVQ
jgi:hypothetical protein